MSLTKLFLLSMRARPFESVMFVVFISWALYDMLVGNHTDSWIEALIAGFFLSELFHVSASIDNARRE